MRRSAVLAILALLAVAAGAFYFWNRPSQVDSPRLAKATLSLKWLYDPGFAGEMVAAKHGEFAREGLDIDLQPGGFEINPISLVASGASQFGVAGADTFLIARSQGLPIVAIATGYVKTPVAFYSHADAGIRSMSDLKGKTIGMQAGQDTETIFQAMLGKAGMSLADVKVFPAKYDLSPFLERQVDVWPGYIATQSYVLRQQDVPFNVLRPNAIGIDIPGTVYFTSEEFLETHPDEVRAFVRAVLAGWKYTYENEDRAANLVASYDTKSLPKALVMANFRDQEDQIRPPGYEYGEIRRTDWEQLAQILQDQGLLKGAVDLDAALKPQVPSP